MARTSQTSGPGADRDLVDARSGAVLEVARRFRTSVALEQLSELLPNGGPEGERAVARWMGDHPSLGTVVGDRIVDDPAGAVADGTERRARGERYFAEASAALRGPLRPIRRWVRCVAVTGSAAYGEPAAGDDLDFFVIARGGAVWPAILGTFLAARLYRRKASLENPSHWCFNYVLDERAARVEFGTPQGFLFAREALTARPVYGDPYYRGLVGASGWLSEELPRLYRRWTVEGLPGLPPDDPAPASVRALNALLYPFVATYLTLVAIARNHRLRAAGRPEKQFRVIARLDRLSYETEQFETLRTLFHRATIVHPVETA